MMQEKCSLLASSELRYGHKCLMRSNKRGEMMWACGGWKPLLLENVQNVATGSECSSCLSSVLKPKVLEDNMARVQHVMQMVFLWVGNHSLKHNYEKCKTDKWFEMFSFYLSATLARIWPLLRVILMTIWKTNSTWLKIEIPRVKLCSPLWFVPAFSKRKSYPGDGSRGHHKGKGWEWFKYI